LRQLKEISSQGDANMKSSNLFYDAEKDVTIIAPMVRSPQSAVKREKVLACVAGLSAFCPIPSCAEDRASGRRGRASQPFVIFVEK
jgi:hypothetical protein